MKRPTRKHYKFFDEDGESEGVDLSDALYFIRRENDIEEFGDFTDEVDCTNEAMGLWFGSLKLGQYCDLLIGDPFHVTNAKFIGFEKVEFAPNYMWLWLKFQVAKKSIWITDRHRNSIRWRPPNSEFNFICPYCGTAIEYVSIWQNTCGEARIDINGRGSVEMADCGNDYNVECPECCASLIDETTLDW